MAHLIEEEAVMGLTRRQTISGGALALLGTGFFGRVDKVAAMQKPLSMTDALSRQATGTSEPFRSSLRARASAASWRAPSRSPLAFR